MVRMRMRYTFSFAVSGTTVQVFRGNSIYDPYLTGAGHQPAYHDWLATQYGAYYVSASSVRFKFTNNAASDVSAMALVPSNKDMTSSIALMSYTHLCELPGSKVRTISSARASRGGTLSYRMSTRKMFGFGFNKDEVSANSGANPTAEWYWNFLLYPHAGGTGVSGYLEAWFYYDVLFFNKELEPPQD